MSVFRNVRIHPSHGTRSAIVTWEIQSGTPAGDVYVAYSESGTQGSWEALNSSAPVPSATGMYMDERLVINSGSVDGYYSLMLVADGTDYKSEPIAILGDITRREYGIIRGIIHREFTEMRVTNGYPVWHCIPREHGELSDAYDPDTDEVDVQCGVENSSFGMKYKGGFYPPVLTWIRVMDMAQGITSDDLSPEDIDKLTVRMMAFPRPRLGHMIVDPTTDKRYLIGETVKPYMLRGVMPIAFETTLEFLSPKDPRYKFETPEIDTKAYRKLKYWTPQI